LEQRVEQLSAEVKRVKGECLPEGKMLCPQMAKLPI
jgi:hypothetical protein